MKARNKFSVVELVLDHVDTLRSHSNGKLSVLDLAVFFGVPAACGAAVWFTGTQVRHVAELLSAVAILTGLIFNVFVLLFDLTMRAASQPEQGQRSTLMKLASELRANISYAVLVGILLTALLGAFVMLSDSPTLPVIPSILVVFGGVQMLLAIFMVLKRIRSLYRAYLTALPEPVP